MELQLVVEPSNSYLFSTMNEQDRQAVFNRAKLFNREVSGLTLEELKYDQALDKNYRALAVFSDGRNNNIIAIAEGIKVPIYAFTYGVELVQFYFENSTLNLDNDVLDHSLVARKHA